MKRLNLSDDVTALCHESSDGSEVLLFRRNEGFLGRRTFAETGPALHERLAGLMVNPQQPRNQGFLRAAQSRVRRLAEYDNDVNDVMEQPLRGGSRKSDLVMA